MHKFGPVTTDSKEEVLSNLLRTTRWHFPVRNQSWRSNMVTLNPYYVSGFVDGEGCFNVAIGKRKGLKLGIEIRASFSVSQGRSSHDLIKNLSLFFNSTKSNIRVDRETLKYETRALDHIISEIIVHFDKYPLQSNKQNDFLKFKKVCLLLEQKKHLTKAGLEEIIKIAYSMNLNAALQSRRQNTEESWLKLLADK